MEIKETKSTMQDSFIRNVTNYHMPNEGLQPDLKTLHFYCCDAFINIWTLFWRSILCCQYMFRPLQTHYYFDFNGQNIYISLMYGHALWNAISALVQSHYSQICTGNYKKKKFKGPYINVHFKSATLEN